MSSRTQYLQVRMSAEEKVELEALAARAGLDMSSYVRGKVLPDHTRRLAGLFRALREQDGEGRRYVLAEVHDLLNELAPAAFGQAVESVDPERLDPLTRNYVAAMVEHAGASKGTAPPSWTAHVLPLDRPWFAVPFPSLRRHLLKEAPVAFKRRNIFVDSTVGSRV